MKIISTLFLVLITLSGCSPFFATKYQLSINETLDATDLGQQEEITLFEADTVFLLFSILIPTDKVVREC